MKYWGGVIENWTIIVLAFLYALIHWISLIHIHFVQFSFDFFVDTFLLGDLTICKKMVFFPCSVLHWKKKKWNFNMFWLFFSLLPVFLIRPLFNFNTGFSSEFHCDVNISACVVVSVHYFSFNLHVNRTLWQYATSSVSERADMDLENRNMVIQRARSHSV